MSYQQNLLEQLLQQNSVLYLVAATLLLILCIEALTKNQIWRVPALSVYVTTGFWYLIEAVYFPEQLIIFPVQLKSVAYLQVIIFLLAFRLFMPALSNAFLKNAWQPHSSLSFQPDKLLKYLFLLWLLLFAYGVYLLNWDVMTALVPPNGRNGVYMWGRSAVGGATGFIISSASFTYSLLCAFFGVLLPLQTKRSAQLINLCLFALVLPYYLLLGTRNLLLAVLLPGYFSYMLFSPHLRWFKAVISVGFGVLVNYILIVAIAFRNIGITTYLTLSQETGDVLGTTKHLGMNMMQELCFTTGFLQMRRLNPEWGSRYLTELLNFIPRAIWPGKPLLGIDYALLRGFGDSSSASGVFATLSYGFIGQGLLDFGLYLGPIAPGFILAAWVGFLSMLLYQSDSVLRRCLFLVGLALTFNLGRGISLLVLWPMVFGYVIVRVLENIQATQDSSPERYRSAKTEVATKAQL